jgi:hypothetical protein
MKYYYTNAQNQPTGPVELEELQRLADQGVIDDQTHVTPEGGKTWIKYGQVRRPVTFVNVPSAALGGSPTDEDVDPPSLVNMVFGLVLSVVGNLALPWKIFAGATRELAAWGNARALPPRSSEMPVLTFSIAVLRYSTAVVFGSVFAIWAILSLFGTGPLYHSAGLLVITRPGFAPAVIAGPAAWKAGPAFGGFLFGLLFGYFGQLVIAFWYEILWGSVQVANDVRRIASK